MFNMSRIQDMHDRGINVFRLAEPSKLLDMDV